MQPNLEEIAERPNGERIARHNGRSRFGQLSATALIASKLRINFAGLVIFI